MHQAIHPNSQIRLLPLLLSRYLLSSGKSLQQHSPLNSCGITAPGHFLLRFRQGEAVVPGHLCFAKHYLLEMDNLVLQRLLLLLLLLLLPASQG